MLKRIVAPFKEFGLGAGTLYVVDRVMRAISPRLRLHYFEMMVQPIAQKPLLNARVSKWLEIREVKADDPETERMPVRPGIVPARFAQGAICLGAFQKGRMVGYMWFCFNSYQEDVVRCTYLLESAKNSVFDFDIYIFPEHRMGLVFVGLWNGANAYLRERGVDYTFSRLTRFNLESRRAHQHFGWKRAARAFFLELFGLQVLLTSAAPYFNVSVGSRSSAYLKLRPDVLKSRTPEGR